MKTRVFCTLMLCIIIFSCERPEIDHVDTGATDEGTHYEFVLEDGNNLYGRVTETATGAPLSGIPVTDGYNYVLTDEGGYYQMKAWSSDNEYARTVALSVPAEFEIPFSDGGYHSFYSHIVKDAEGLCRRDFTLSRRTQMYQDFTLVSLADIHIQTDAHLARFEEETVPDILETISAGEDRGIYKNTLVVTLGDNVWDNPDQFGPFKKAMSDMRLSGGRQLNMIPCIGNHDTISKDGDTDFAITGRYVDNFGPYDFSFDLGQVHFVFMKNFVRVGVAGNTVETKCGFQDTQMEWLRQDIELVEDREDKLLVFCCHYPVHELVGAQKKEFFELACSFNEVHFLTGHHHGVYNRIFTSNIAKGGRPAYDHNQVAACGTWWRSNINPDGVPNGYMIYNIKGNTVSSWYLKPTGSAIAQDQLRLYDGAAAYPALSGNEYGWDDMLSDVSSTFVAEDKYLARVYCADTRNWSVDFVQNGVSVPMTRISSSIFDACTYAFTWTYPNSGFYRPGADRYKVKNTNYWYIEKDKVDLSGEWVVKAWHTLPDGSRLEYRTSHVQEGFEGF